jgi:hypothetical protein
LSDLPVALARSQPIARGTERHCHDWVHRERTLEIRDDLGTSSRRPIAVTPAPSRSI